MIRNINILTNRYINSLFNKFSYDYSQKVYQKINITRLPQQKYSIYLDTNDNCETLFSHLNSLFPGTTYILTNSYQNKLGQQITQNDQELHSQIISQSVIQLLINNNLLIYEQKDNKFLICLGMTVSELNISSNRNLPQHIANNIIQLSQQWRTDRPIEVALKKQQNIVPEIRKQMQQQRNEMIQQAKNNYANYLSLYKFYKTGYIDSGRTLRLGVNLVALMTVNWGFLFAVTYGKYGWDVGEPLSYLTSLTVDLIAMMGFFKAEESLQQIGNVDFKKASLLMNLQSQLKMRQFQISYYKRQL